MDFLLLKHVRKGAALAVWAGVVWMGLAGMHRGLWLDEAWVANSLRSATSGEMWWGGEWLQTSPPLFLALGRVWLAVAGLSVEALRVVPLVFALVAVAAGAIVGAIDGFRHRLVRYKAAMLMAACGIPMTHLGQTWAHALPQHLLMAGFAALMLAVARRFYGQARMDRAASDDVLHWVFINEVTGKFIWTPVTALVLAGIGIFTGLMTGLLGVGGGFLIVPLMRRFTNLSMAGIVATSLFLISMVSGGGVVNAGFAVSSYIPGDLTVTQIARSVSLSGASATYTWDDSRPTLVAAQTPSGGGGAVTQTRMAEKVAMALL